MGPLAEAVEALIAALEVSGRLTDDRLVQVGMLREMAKAVDANPDRGSLWREFRMAEATFRAELMRTGAPDDLERLQAALLADVRHGADI